MITSQIWVVINIVSIFITAIASYSLGRSNRNNIRKPKAITCDHLYWNSKIYANCICKQIWRTCKSGFCREHCKSQDCDCNVQTKLETEILEEVRQITGS